MVKLNTKKEYSIEILENGIIQLLVQTIYLRDDETEIVRDNWRTILEPGQYDKVEELGLEEYHLNIIKAAWTNEVIELYQLEKMKKEAADQATEESGF